ncbi:MAG: hypothetical protein IEMM0002_0664 [bacterium]|nr:MAG: hypothetical protein IEMM0002_0664 [bacterium]
MNRNQRSIRIKRYDYSRAGAYFVTICTQNRECLFGDVVDGEMVLNDAGRIVDDEWEKSADIRDEIELDEFVIMPNHFHGVVCIHDDGRGTARRARGSTARRAPTGERFGKPVPGSLPTIIRSFKSAVTKRINEMHRAPGVTLWQRGFYEHVIRNERELTRVRQYITDNTAKWELDRENPDRIQREGE